MVSNFLKHPVVFQARASAEIFGKTPDHPFKKNKYITKIPDAKSCFITAITDYILAYPALDYPVPRLTGRVSLLLKGEKALSNKPLSFRFSAIVLMKVKLFINLFC